MNPYLALEVGWMRHPKVRKVHRDARLLWIVAGLYAVEAETDGVIEKHMLDLLAAQADVKATRARELVAAGLWEDAGDQYVIHDFLIYNPSHEQRETLRKKWRDKKRRQRDTLGESPGDSDGVSRRLLSSSSSVSSPLLLQQQRARDLPAAAAAAIEIILNIRREQDSSTIRNQERWSTFMRDELVDQHAEILLSHLAECNGECDPRDLVIACGFTLVDVARATRNGDQ